MSTQSKIRFHNTKICRTRECAKRTGNGKSREPLRSLGNLRTLMIAYAMLQAAWAEDDAALAETDRADVVQALWEDLTKADVLTDAAKADMSLITAEHVKWDAADKEFDLNLEHKAEGAESIFKDPTKWKDTLKEADETAYNVIEDGKIQTAEWDSDKSELVEAGWDWWVWVAIGAGVLTIIGGFALWWFRCRNTESPTDATQPGDRRRLVVTPISEISHELGSTMLPVTPRVRQLRSNTLRAGNEVCDSDLILPGLDNENIWWAIPLSCLTQLFWIYVIYRTYKACKSRCSEKQSPQELREITVRR